MKTLKEFDPEMYEIVQNEKKRQTEHIELIASENFASANVRELCGSILTNKYAEGYPGKRYYGGCENVDKAEMLAIERVCKLFNVKYANVQPHSGSQANMAVYRSLLTHGDKVLGMSLDAGGHLTHGYKLSFSGIDYETYGYGLNPETEQLDYDEIEKLALEIKPKMIIAGASAYSRYIDFKRFREIADKVGAYLFVDMAHIAGLVAAGLHQNPCEYAHVVTSTTHKTLRGPRGGIILSNDEEIIKKINKTTFPGIQGGPLMHIIAAKAVAFKEALDPSYKEYMAQVKKNAEVLASELTKRGYRIVSGGTDNHLMIVDLRAVGVNGREAENLLHSVNITTNKNSIPNDPEPPLRSSGIRLGTPAMTTRGFKEKEFKEVARWIDETLRNKDNPAKLEQIKKEVVELTVRYPLP